MDDIIRPSEPRRHHKGQRQRRSIQSLDSARSVMVKDKPKSSHSKPSHSHIPPQADVVIDEAELENKVSQPEKPKTPKKQRFIWWHKLSRNKRFAIIAFGLLLFGAAVIGFYYFTRPHSQPSISITRAAKPITVASPLTGVQVTPDLAKRPVTGIMIENSTDARPQSGIQDAGVVYEAIAEGGVTRFLTLYQENRPQYIGPVRSLRPYYIDYAAPFQASIVHVGGSPDALSEVGNYRNLDQFSNGSYFIRVTSRPAPHNVYTNFDKLDALNSSKGYKSSKFTSWPRKKDAKTATPTAKTIDVAISGPIYNAHYDYDTSTNSYARSEGGAIHRVVVSATDTAGVQLKPKVVIAIVVPLGQGALDASGAYYSDYTTTGSGQAYIFQDGGVTIGSWSKDVTSGQISFTDANDAPVKLNAGQTWISLVTGPSSVNYKP